MSNNVVNAYRFVADQVGRFAGCGGGSYSGGADWNAQFETYDGSTWTSQTEMTTPRYDSAGGGSGYDGFLAIGGRDYSNLDSVEAWSGSSWSNTNSLNSGRHNLAGDGIPTTNAISMGGSPSVVETRTTGAWTTDTSGTFTGVEGLAGGAFSGSAWSGTTNAISMGGYGDTDATQSWNGSTWTAETNMPTAQGGNAGGGFSTSAITFGGNEDSYSVITQVWDGSWSSGGDMNIPRIGCGGGGTPDNALVFGGNNGDGVIGSTEHYGDSTWSSGGDLNVNTTRMSSGVGSVT